MSKHYEETFYIVPTYIRKLPDITLGYMDVYSIMFQFWNKGLECYMDNKEFIIRTGYTKQYLAEAFRFFESFNELKRLVIGKKRYLIQPEKRIQSDCEQPVGNISHGKPQFPTRETTVSHTGKPQFPKKQSKKPLQATQRKPHSVSILPLNKESLNKELKYHNHEYDISNETMRAAELSREEKHAYEVLTSMGMVDRLASKIAKGQTLATINNIIEVGTYKGVKNMGAYINTSIKNAKQERANE